MERRRLAHISEALPARVVINCTGLGPRTLGGTEDDKVYPTGGQTLLNRAPWLKACRDHGTADAQTYVRRCADRCSVDVGMCAQIIFRKSGDVIVGGTYEAEDWHDKPREETTQRLRRVAIELCPELLPEEKRAARRVDNPDIVADDWCVAASFTAL